MASLVILPVKRPEGSDKVGKGNSLGASFVAKTAGETSPGFFLNIPRTNTLFNCGFGDKAGGKFPIYLSQRTRPRTFSTFNTMKYAIFFNQFFQFVKKVQ
jgi:hypothetical protein